MRIRTKRILFITFMVILVAAAPFAFRKYREWREMHEEEALKKLPIDALNIKSATFDDALRQITKKVHALGHPELELHIYSSGRECPYFRGRQHDEMLERASTIDLRVVPDRGRQKLYCESWAAAGPPVSLGSGSTGGQPVTLDQVLYEIGNLFGLPCAVRGHELVATHAPGTLHRYVHATIRLDRDFFENRSDQDLKGAPEGWGITYYDGMEIEFRRNQSEVAFFGPRDQFELLDTDVSPHPASRWEEFKSTVWIWRIRYSPF